MKKEMSKKKKIIFGIVGAVAALGLIVLIAIIYVNAGYRTAKGTFDYTLRFNAREYEFIATSSSLDMYQIIDLSKADNDCYVYVGTYDPEQDLQETLDIVNLTDGTELELMTTTIGSKDYPASFVGFISEEGGYAYVYFVDYMGKNYVISTLSDKRHEGDIEEMLESFTINE